MSWNMRYISTHEDIAPWWHKNVSGCRAWYLTVLHLPKLTLTGTLSTYKQRIMVNGNNLDTIHAIKHISILIYIESHDYNWCMCVCYELGTIVRNHVSRHWCILAITHDDVIKWKHFPRYWPFVRGIHRSPMKSPHKGQKLWCFFDLRPNKLLSKQS